MKKDDIINKAIDFTNNSALNYISKEAALKPEYAGIKIFDDPIFAFGSADDDIFNRFKSDDVISDRFLTPVEWLPEAKTVISFFLPHTEKIRSSNANDYDWPSDEWLHGRIEGQLLVKELSIYLENILLESGYKSLAPSLDERFKTGKAMPVAFTSNWSERHAAFACGLGTFGLSKGIITKKGMAGRFGSVITAMDLPKDNRPYKDIYEYCNKCGACAKHCPVDAISLEDGKIHKPCSDFLDETLEKFNPRYGCGKCQVKVPCEKGIPKK